MAFEQTSAVQDTDARADDIQRDAQGNGSDGANTTHDGQDVNQDTNTQATDPWAAPLPEGVSFGEAKSFGDLRSQFEQAQQQAALAEAYRELYAEAQQGRQAAPGAQVQAPSEKNFWGYGSQEKLRAAMSADYEGTWNRIMDARLEARMKQLEKERIQPMHQQLTSQLTDANAAAVVRNYPEAGNQALYATPEFKAFAAKNNGWLGELGQARPDLNIQEVGFKLFHYDALRKELAAYKAKHGEIQKASGVTRSSVGGQHVTQGKPKNHQEAINRAAALLRAQGKAVPQEWIDAARRGVRN